MNECRVRKQIRVKRKTKAYLSILSAVFEDIAIGKTEHAKRSLFRSSMRLTESQ